MTTGRVLWIIWCLFWAAAWFVLGLVTVVGVLVFWPLALVSVVAILLPVGRPVPPPQAYCPACGAAGEPTLLPLHMQTAHGVGGPGQLGPGGPAQPAGPKVIEHRPYGPPPAWPTYSSPLGQRAFPPPAGPLQGP